MSVACPVCGAYQREVLDFVVQIAGIPMTHHGKANGLLSKELRDQARGLLSVVPASAAPRVTREAEHDAP